MQFDFLKGLFGKTKPKAAPREALPRAKQAKSMPTAGLPTEAELLDCAHGLLIAAGALDLAARLQIRWSPRMRSTAGLAYYRQSLIKLNPRIAEFPGEVDRTLRHELAHLLAHHRAGRRKITPHGMEWRKACRDLGLANETRTHTLPLPRTQRRRPHVYRCAGCGQEVRRAIPFKTSSACLRCCRAHSGGRYDKRFRFVKVQAE